MPSPRILGVLSTVGFIVVQVHAASCSPENWSQRKNRQRVCINLHIKCQHVNWRHEDTAIGRQRWSQHSTELSDRGDRHPKRLQNALLCWAVPWRFGLKISSLCWKRNRMEQISPRARIRLVSGILIIPSLYDFFKFIGTYDESLQDGSIHVKTLRSHKLKRTSSHLMIECFAAFNPAPCSLRWIAGAQAASRRRSSWTDWEHQPAGFVQLAKGNTKG